LKKALANNFSFQAHILLVEDDVLTLDISKFILQQDGHTVTIASNGKDALIILNGPVNSSNPISLVITDLAMPVMSGVDFILEMRKRDFSMPVVVTTGHIESYSEPEIQNIRADQILFKPFNPTDLTDCVKTILARKRVDASCIARQGSATRLPSSRAQAEGSSSKSDGFLRRQGYGGQVAEARRATASRTELGQAG
jgi:DNA-binding response OmpR family regulator